MARLFDDLQRSDPSPASAGEDSFAFLNRVDTPFWGEVRRLLEEWFERYPDAEAPELRRRFRSKLPGHHWAAWWELYLHELFRRLGYSVTVHPELPDSRKLPDFELQRDGSRLYLEATVVFSGIAPDDGDQDAPPWLLDAVDDARNGNFFVRLVAVERAGPNRLKDREIAQPLQEWLDELDPDEAIGEHERGEGFRQLSISRRGWDVVFEAWPVRPEARGKADHRVLGAGPIQAGWVNDIDQLHSKLKAKAGRYGRPPLPLVTAVLCMSSFMDRLDIEQALFGKEAIRLSVDGPPDGQLFRQRNGFWVRRHGPQNRRVSAVLTAAGLHPWNAPDVVPTLWLNPWADYALTEDWPFTEVTGRESGEIIYEDADPDMHAILDLPADWPGGEAFPRRPG